MVRELDNERELIHGCQDGDLAAYAAVYRHFEQPLLNIGLRMLGRQEDAEDAVQTVFIRLYRGIGGFRFQSKFSSYLYRIMMNVCFDMLARKKMTAIPAKFTTEPGYLTQDDLRLQLEQALHQLPERMKACFVLFAVQGFKQQEIAEILKLNVGTVKAHVFQAKQKLRQMLSETAGGE